MEKEAQEFVEALCRFVEQELQRDPDPIYSQKAVKIADARNHLFRIVEPARTDEAEDLYALADLCRLDEETMGEKVRATYWIDFEVNGQRED